MTTQRPPLRSWIGERGKAADVYDGDVVHARRWYLAKPVNPCGSHRTYLTPAGRARSVDNHGGVTVVVVDSRAAMGTPGRKAVGKARANHATSVVSC